LREHDAVAGGGRLGLALLVGGEQLELAAEHLVVVLHRLAGPALEVDVRGEMGLGHGGFLLFSWVRIASLLAGPASRGRALKRRGPKMFSVPITEFEARPGGKIFLGQRGPDGAMHYNAGVVREIERPSRLVFAIHFADADRRRVAPPAGTGLSGTWDQEIVSSVTFSAEGRRTRVTIRVTRSGVTPEWIEMARVGWGQSLDKLGYAVVDDMT